MKNCPLPLALMHLLILLQAGSILLPAGSAEGQEPGLSHATPQAIAPGQTADVTFHGSNLAGATGLWTSFPATVELAPDIENNGNDAAKVTYRITVPADTAVGIGGVRLWTKGGVSNPRLFLIDDLPTVFDNGQNKTRETAQEITLPVAIDGTCEAESFDFYKFNGHAGQRVSCEVIARRLGTPLDPVIRLLDSSGKELAYSDDEGGIAVDSRLALTLPADGQYLIEIRDIRYHGGGDHRYRLRVGDFPLANTAYPMGGQKGSSPMVTVMGPEPSLPRQNIAIPADPGTEQISVGVKRPGGGGSALLTMVAGDVPEEVEFEPNDQPDQASVVSLPSAVNGRFDVAKDRDYYQFDVKKGQRFVFRGMTRQLGSPSDIFMQLYKSDGAKLAEAEDAGTSEGVIDYTFPEDGTLRLMVEDLHRRGGSEFAYRVEIKPFEPGFSLAAEAERLNVPKGGVFVVKVTCARRGYDGPITLSVAGAGEGLALAGNVIPEKKNETTLNVTVPSAIEQGQLLNIRIVGKAQIGEKEFTATASTMGPLRGAFSGLPNPPASLDGVIGLGVAGPFPDFFKLLVDGGHVAYPQLVGKTTLKVKTERLNKFDGPINLAVDGLPAGVTAEVKPIEKGKGEIDIAVSGVAALAEGDYPIRITGTAAHQNQPKTVVLNDVILRVVKPLAVQLAPAGPLTAGATQKLKVVLTRYGEEKGPVTVRLENLPPGVSGPEGITIAEGQNEIDVDLTATADANVGMCDKLYAVVHGTVSGRSIVAQSATAALEVMPAAAAAQAP